MPACHTLVAKRKEATEAFCQCCKEPGNSTIGQRLPCSCGEDFSVYEWAWDDKITTTSTRLSVDNREVQFHPVYSNGTAAVRGNAPCTPGNDYYWEIKMLTALYGTDTMIGVGTEKVNLRRHPYDFCSLLGLDGESWGYSYNGLIQHRGDKRAYGLPFGHGSIVGVHLDMWRGTLQFYLNRKPLGVAFTSLHGQTLYPMICSTAAKSAMRVIYSASAPNTLQLLCLQSIRSKPDLVRTLRRVPFLRSHVDNNYWWLIPTQQDSIHTDDGKEDEDSFFNDSGELDVNLAMCMEMVRDEERATDEDRENWAQIKRKRDETASIREQQGTHTKCYRSEEMSCVL